HFERCCARRRTPHRANARDPARLALAIRTKAPRAAPHHRPEAGQRHRTEGPTELGALTVLASPLRAQNEPIVLARPAGPLIYATVEPEPFIRIGESYGAGEYRFGTSVVPLLRTGDSVLAAVPWRADVRLFDS